MIIHFTGTGNSRYAAEFLGSITDDSVVDSFEYIKEDKKGEFTSDRPYVFVCPTYAWRIPRIFNEFIKKGTFNGSRKAYFVMTCGDSVGRAGYYIQKLCQHKGFEFMGLLKAVMPENYIAMFPVPGVEESGRIIAVANKVIAHNARLIMEQKPLPQNKGGIAGWLASTIVNPLFYPLFVSAKGFYPTNKCTGCGMCVQVCPLNNIGIDKDRPIWGKNCTHCMACICRCPAEAIEYKKASIGKRRYYNKGYKEV